MAITFRQTSDTRGTNKGQRLNGSEYDQTIIDLLNNGTRTYDNISALRATNPSAWDDDTVVYVKGYNSVGDGGGGLFYWDNASTATDNGGTIIQSTGVTAGRWIRPSVGFVDVKWFGAVGDNSTDSTDAIQAALDVGGVAIIPEGIYRISDTLFLSRSSSLKGVGTNRSVIVQNDNTKEVIYVNQEKSAGTVVLDNVLSDFRVSGGSVGIRFGVNDTTGYGLKTTIERVWMYLNTKGCLIENGWELYFFKCIFDLNDEENLIIENPTFPAFQNTTKFEQCDFTNSSFTQNVDIRNEVLHNTSFDNCVFQGGRDTSTVAINVTCPFINELKITGCYFEDYDNYYIKLPNDNRNAAIEISNNSFIDNPTRTAPMISTINGVMLESNYFDTSDGSTALEGATRSRIINNRRTSTGTDILPLISYSDITNCLMSEYGDALYSSTIKYGVSGSTHADYSETKVVPISGADLFQMKLSDTFGSAIIDINAVATNASGTRLYFSGKRIVHFTSGTFINVLTLGTDASLNCGINITYVSNRTFKVSITNSTGSSAGFAVTANITGGGGNGDSGVIEFILPL